MSDERADDRPGEATAEPVDDEATAEPVDDEAIAEPVDDEATVQPMDSDTSVAAVGTEASAAPQTTEEAGIDVAAVPDDQRGDEYERIERLSILFDESIELPGGYRIGLDPILGILPVAGDLVASAVSVYIVMEAAYLGVPRATLARMVLTVVVDTVVGSVPVVGPVFDAAFKANARNVALLERRIEAPGAASADRRVLFALGVVFVALAVALAAVAGVAIWRLAVWGGLG